MEVLLHPVVPEELVERQVAVPEPDPARLPDERRPLVKLPQVLLGPLPLGDVDAGSGYVKRPAQPVAEGPSAVVQPVDGPIGPDDPEFHREVRPLLLAPAAPLDDPRPIVRMDQLHERLERPHGLAGWEAEEAVKLLVPVEGVGDDVPAERTGSRRRERGIEPFSTLAEGCLGPLLGVMSVVVPTTRSGVPSSPLRRTPRVLNQQYAPSYRRRR